MFRYCVWYVLDNQFSEIVKRNASLFQTQAYIPHITIKSNLSLQEAQLMAKSYAINPIYNTTIRIYGTVVQTHAMISDGTKAIDFYALEQRLIVNGMETNAHISLAYSKKPFSDMEIALANVGMPEIIFNVKVCVADCRLSPDKWKIVDV